MMVEGAEERQLKGRSTFWRPTATTGATQPRPAPDVPSVTLANPIVACSVPFRAMRLSNEPVTTVSARAVGMLRTCGHECLGDVRT